MFLTIAVLVVLIVFIAWIRSSPFYWRVRGVPSTLPLPLLGNCLSTLTHSLRDQALNNYAKWRGHPYWGFHFFMQPAIGLRDPALIRRALSSDSFLSLAFYTGHDRDPIAPSLLYANGDAWRQTRSKLSTSFSPSKVKGVLPVVNSSIDSLLEELKKSKAEANGPVAVSELNLSFSTDAVTRNAFGIESYAFDDDSFLVALQKQMLKTTTLFKVMLGIFSPRLHDMLGLTMLDSRTNKEMVRVLGSVISNRVKGIGVRQDFMQNMVEFMVSQPPDDGPKLNPDNTLVPRVNERWVVAQCMTLYMAGTEAVANTLSFAMYELALNQDIQDKARQEANTVLAQPGDLYEAITHANYISNIINEVLRLYPLISSLIRKCTKDFELEEGLIIKKGTMLSIPAFGLHMDPDFFPDPTRFNPERHSENVVPGTFFPFGYGQRICIGYRFGMNTLALALIRLLTTYRFSPCPLTEIPLQFHPTAVTTTPKNPIFLSVEPVA